MNGKGMILNNASLPFPCRSFPCLKFAGLNFTIPKA